MGVADMKFDFGSKVLKKSGTSKPTATKKAPAQKASRPAAPRPVGKTQRVAPQPVLKGGVCYRKYEGDALLLPNTTRPAWLDGSLPGDRGFDPLGLAKPVEYLQFDLDQLDQNNVQNKAGGVIGSLRPAVDEVTTQSLQPYSEVFGLQRFRECELIHGRWAMLATLGIIVAESSTGVSWVDAGKIELDGARSLTLNCLSRSVSYAGLRQLPWAVQNFIAIVNLMQISVSTLAVFLTPWVWQHPVKLTTIVLIVYERQKLNMVAWQWWLFFGFGIQALTTGEGALGSLAKFASTL